MTKPTGPACNLDCEYCYYLDKSELYPEKSQYSMDEETLETFIRQYIEAQPGPVVSFAWQGGEPTLLGVEFFRTVVRLQEKYVPATKTVENALQTNGTLLDDEWGEFLTDNDFLVGISIDGPRKRHNRFRRTRTNGPTFDRVMDGLSILKDHDVEYNVLCVVNAINSHHPLEVYDFFLDHGSEWLQFIPLVEPINTETAPSNDDCDSPSDHGHRDMPSWVRDRGGDVTEQDPDFAAVATKARTASVSARSVDPVQYGRFMADIFDRWVRNDIGRISIRLFDQCLERRLYDRASLCLFRETCGSQVALEHNGDIYACDHYVDQGFKRGNIHETPLANLVESTTQREFGQYKRDGLPARCHTCPVQAYCNGGCPKNWELVSPAGDPGLNYLCAGYRLFFTYVQPYLNLFAASIDRGLPPTVVGETVVRADSG